MMRTQKKEMREISYKGRKKGIGCINKRTVIRAKKKISPEDSGLR